MVDHSSGESMKFASDGRVMVSVSGGAMNNVVALVWAEGGARQQNRQTIWRFGETGGNDVLGAL